MLQSKPLRIPRPGVQGLSQCSLDTNRPSAITPAPLPAIFALRWRILNHAEKIGHAKVLILALVLRGLK